MSVNLTENVLPVPFPWILSPYSVHCSSSHLRTVPGMHLHITALKTKEVSDLPAVHYLFIYLFYWRRVIKQCTGVLLALSFNKQNGLSGRRTVFEGGDVGGTIV